MITLLLLLVLLGVGLYLIETYVPMAAPIKLIIRIVVVIFIVLLLLRAFGVADVPVPACVGACTMAKKSKKPKAKQLPAKKKGAKKKPARPSRGFDAAAADRLTEQVQSLTERVRELEQWRWRDGLSDAPDAPDDMHRADA